MITSDRFLKFAAECKSMAKVSPSPENKAVWDDLAQRWIRCAELMNRQILNDHVRPLVKRRRPKVYNSN